MTMADVLRIPKNLGAFGTFPALRANVDRAFARSAFRKAHADQIAHFSAEAQGRKEHSK